MAAVSPTAVVLASSNGRLMRLDHGAAAPTWTASLGEPAAGHPDPVMVANERVVVARDVRKRAHAFDASTGAPLWQRPADGVALTAGTDGDVLIAAATLQRVAARDGRPRWSRLTGHDTQLHAVGSEVAVISNGPVVAMVRLADGTLWSLDLRPLVPGGYLESNTVQAAVVGEGRRVLVAAWGQLFVLAAADGQLLATLRFAAPADVITMGERASSRLITAPGGRAWWVVHYYGTRRGKSGWRNTVKLVNGDGVVVTRSDDAAGDVAALGDGSLLREREWGTELLEVPAGAPK